MKIGLSLFEKSQQALNEPTNKIQKRPITIPLGRGKNRASRVEQRKVVNAVYVHVAVKRMHRFRRICVQNLVFQVQ